MDDFSDIDLILSNKILDESGNLLEEPLLDETDTGQRNVDTASAHSPQQVRFDSLGQDMSFYPLSPSFDLDIQHSETTPQQLSHSQTELQLQDQDQDQLQLEMKQEDTNIDAGTDRKSVV